jgi:hypothetical protein
MPPDTSRNGKVYVRYDVVAGTGGEWVVRREGSDLARRGTRDAAKALASHVAWRESSHRHVQTVVHCESADDKTPVGEKAVY